MNRVRDDVEKIQSRIQEDSRRVQEDPEPHSGRFQARAEKRARFARTGFPIRASL
jgi:gas vesicle protein